MLFFFSHLYEQLWLWHNNLLPQIIVRIPDLTKLIKNLSLHIFAHHLSTTSLTSYWHSEFIAIILAQVHDKCCEA